MKALLLSNTTWNIFNFRLNLAEALRDQGFEVVTSGVKDGFEDKIRDRGFGWTEWKITRRSLNPFSELVAINNLRRIYAQEKPDIVQHFTVKPVLYGTIAAKLAGVPAVVNSITGLPYMLTSKPDRGVSGIAKKVSLTWYARCCHGKNLRSLFQNSDDRDMLASYDSRVKESSTLTPGSGVDLARFPHVPPASNNDTVRIVCVSRLIREKGVFDLVEAAKKVLRTDRNVEFVFCGLPDPGNRTSVAPDMLEQWKQINGLTFLGQVEDVPAELIRSDIVVLPSYREGMPRSLLEAAAIGRPIVTSNVTGCREVVDHDSSGFLVPSQDPDALASALTKLIDDPELRKSMGRAARLKAESQFDERFVINQTLAVYQALLGDRP